ncbi:MAG: cyclic nucleotide-binding domain-containing protein [Catonella sp.]|uniref:cyclic nucleotide-binding domain-containing protein n=1 Tax=Catonella sp. TaxID=2382125 RepID=UPI003F9FA1DA
MAEFIIKAGDVIATAGRSINKMWIIKSGRVRVEGAGGSYELGPGDVVGICEVFLEVHFLTYVAIEDTETYMYPIVGAEAIGSILKSNVEIARMFIRSCIRQITKLIYAYRTEQVRCNAIYDSLKACYNIYLNLAEYVGVELKRNQGIEELEAYTNNEEPDYWLSGYYEGLNRLYAGENYKLLIAEPDVSVGMLRKGCLDARKSVLLMGDRYQFIKKCLNYYFLEEEGGLFSKLLAVFERFQADANIKNNFLNKMNIIVYEAAKFPMNSSGSLGARIKQCAEELKRLRNNTSIQEDEVQENSEPDFMEELYESLDTILDFAEIVGAERRLFRINIGKLNSLSDKNAIDDETMALKRDITAEFYQIYSEVFFKSLEKEIPPAVRMFLYFGYIDENLAGKKHTKTLYNLSEELKTNDPSVSGVYTFYDWLLAIYRGEKKPCRNEFDVDFSDYVRELKNAKKITPQEAETLLEDGEAKVNYELDNIFKTANKITFGRVSTFCPVFIEGNILKEVKDCIVKVGNIRRNLDVVKSVDYSAFYRETLALSDGDVMAREHIHIEKIPDFILLPNAGVRGIMWQEIEGKVRITPGRMFISVLHMEDLQNTIIRMTGEFRWELCKRVQGARWNDVTDPSLTSLYCDYVQFYRKNSNLSPEMKEKVKLSLQRCRNSFKEMFVQDYITYILYEGNGSPRLNKVARQILFEFCPPDAEGIERLSKNPTYMELIKQKQFKLEQKLQRYEGLERKCLKETGSIPESLKKEINFIKGIV